jgi:hypothetical protein
MMLRYNRALDKIDRRLDQHEQALLELTAAQNWREDMPATKETDESRKP